MIKKLALPLLAVGLLLSPVAAKAAGPTYGASAPYYGGSNTYGYSWAGWDGKNCSTTTTIGGQSWTATDDDWAQTGNCHYPGNWNVYESHSFR